MRILLLLLLSGCSSPEMDRLLFGPSQEERQAATIQRLGAVCTRLGYSPNSDAWRDCVLKVAQMEQQREIATQPTRPAQCYRDSYGVVCY